MLKILIVALAMIGCAAADVSVELKNTTQGYGDKAVGYHGYRETNTPEASVKIHGELGDNLDVVVKASNRLEDTYLDKATVTYSDRVDSTQVVVIGGTLESMNGIFDASKSSVEQPPMINKPSGVYNDEFISGLLDSTIGAEVRVSRLVGSGMVTVGGFVADIRVTDKSKAEAAVANYDSKYIDIDYSKSIRGVKANIDVTSNMNVFYTTAESSFGVKDISGMTYIQKVMWYMQSPSTFDPIIQYVSNERYKFSIDRVGGTYVGKCGTLAYERHTTTVDNNSMKVHTKSTGHYVYGNVYVDEDTTVYAAHSWSRSPEGKQYRENTYGMRSAVSSRVTMLGEYRRTDWMQTDTLEEYKKLDGKPVDVVTLQVIYRY